MQPGSLRPGVPLGSAPEGQDGTLGVRGVATAPSSLGVASPHHPPCLALFPVPAVPLWPVFSGTCQGVRSSGKVRKLAETCSVGPAPEHEGPGGITAPPKGFLPEEREEAGYGQGRGSRTLSSEGWVGV